MLMSVPHVFRRKRTGQRKGHIREGGANGKFGGMRYWKIYQATWFRKNT